MTRLSDQVGQLLIGGFSGTTVDTDFAALQRSGRVGGVVLFARNLPSIPGGLDLVDALGRLPGKPLIVAVDQEGGRVQRLSAPFPQVPPTRVIGATRSPALARDVGTLLGRGLFALGFHQNYAPVLDVDSNPDNPVIGDRSFGDDARSVARLGAAFIDGLQSEGVAACAKHFPGHGDTSVDSHHALPRLDHAMSRLSRVELVPFVAAAQAGCEAMMTAHILFTELDPEHPATLSEKVLGPLLREGIGFRGMIVSDDLEMNAIADHYGVEEAAIRAVRAGCDQLLICHRPGWVARAHEALVRAAETQEIPRSRIEAAAARVTAFKERYVVGRKPGAWSDVRPHLSRLDAGRASSGIPNA